MPATLADIQRKYGESVYPLYKDQMHEPYMENDVLLNPTVVFDNQVVEQIEKLGTQTKVAEVLGCAQETISKSLKRSSGKRKEPKMIRHGYKGVVMYDEAEDKVQCSECGEWFGTITGSHLRGHGLTHEDYKLKYGLALHIPLCSSGHSRKCSEISNKNKDKFAKVYNSKPREYFKNISKLGLKKQKKIGESSSTQNKTGLCDAQIASRLLIVVKMSGKKNINELTSGDIYKNDVRLWASLIRKYKTVKIAAEKLGIRNFSEELSEVNLIAGLRNFVKKYKQMPSSKYMVKVKECKWGLRNFHSYVNCFGSLKRAKMMAGLDQLLEEVKGNERKTIK